MVRDPSIVSPSLTGVFIGGGRGVNIVIICLANESGKFRANLFFFFFTTYRQASQRGNMYSLLYFEDGYLQYIT